MTRRDYRYIRYEGVTYPEHKLSFLFATGMWVTGPLDHINRDGLDNRPWNLRPATPSQNNANRSRKPGRFKRGVSYRPGKPRPFQAAIQVSGRKFSLGYHATENEAHAAYCKAAVEHFGEFARFE